MSPAGDGANRSLSEVDCEDEFTRTVAKFDGAQSADQAPGLNQVRLMMTAVTTKAAAKPVNSPVLGAAEHTLDEIAMNFRCAVAARAADRLPFGPLSASLAPYSFAALPRPTP